MQKQGMTPYSLQSIKVLQGFADESADVGLLHSIYFKSEKHYTVYALYIAHTLQQMQGEIG